MKFWNDFKEFAMQGNMVDMAVGIIIGAAFGKIIDSLVSNVIMPPLSLLTGDRFTELGWILRPEILGPDGDVVREAITMQYGAFIQALLDFFLIALSIFVAIRLMNKARRKAEEEEAVEEEEAPTPADIELLTEIRDLMQEQAGRNRG